MNKFLLISAAGILSLLPALSFAQCAGSSQGPMGMMQCPCEQNQQYDPRSAFGGFNGQPCSCESCDGSQSGPFASQSGQDGVMGFYDEHARTTPCTGAQCDQQLAHPQICHGINCSRTAPCTGGNCSHTTACPGGHCARTNEREQHVRDPRAIIVDRTHTAPIVINRLYPTPVYVNGVNTIEGATSVSYANTNNQSAADQSAADQSSDDQSAVEDAILSALNNVRSQNGLAPLDADDQLAEVAYDHSTDMLDNNYFDHTDKNGCDPVCRLKDAGISYNTMGENIYWATDASNDPESLAQRIVNDWMNSPAHRANILNTSFTTAGIGVADEGSKVDVTVDFTSTQQ